MRTRQAGHIAYPFDISRAPAHRATTSFFTLRPFAIAAWTKRCTSSRSRDARASALRICKLGSIQCFDGFTAVASDDSSAKRRDVPRSPSSPDILGIASGYPLQAHPGPLRHVFEHEMHESPQAHPFRHILQQAAGMGARSWTPSAFAPADAKPAPNPEVMPATSTADRSTLRIRRICNMSTSQPTEHLEWVPVGRAGLGRASSLCECFVAHRSLAAVDSSARGFQ